MVKFHMPTKVYVGEKCLFENKSEFIIGKNAFIVTGKSSGKKSGALDDVISLLENAGISYYVYDKIENNPEINDMVIAGAVAHQLNSDFIIGIGGGSPLDAAKAIAVYATNPANKNGSFEAYDIFTGEYKNKPLPMVAIPTTIGTGSEVTPYSILTLHKEKTKKSFSSPDTFFKSAFLDGRYVLNLPLQVARNTAVDALSHLIEGYTNKKASFASDYIAIEGLKVLGKHFQKLDEGELDVEACTELLWASTLGGIVISQTGTTIVHSMGYELTYFKNIPHGMANGLLLYEYIKHADKKRIAACLYNLGFVTLDGFKNFLNKILPCDCEFSEEEIKGWAEIAIKARNVSSCPFDVTIDDEIEMYRASLIKH